MSGLTLQSVTTAENEFLAEETLITISPNFDHGKLFFTSGSFGPFEAGDRCVVPLWLAINLRKRQKCTIVIPDWMAIESLETNYTNEKNHSIFEPLPFHYREISQLLFLHARDEITSPDTVAALLQDIQSIRMDRAQMGLISIAEQYRRGDISNAIKLPNISAIEILTIKRFLVESLGQLDKLANNSGSAADNYTPSQQYDEAPAQPLRRYRG